MRGALFAAPVLLTLLLTEALLYSTGEVRTVRWVFEQQRRAAMAGETVLFGRRYVDQQFELYKRTGWQTIRPEILVLGSSRVMQIRSENFSDRLGSRGATRFFNAGGMVRNVENFFRLADAMLSEELPAPRVLILGIDPWWLRVDAPDDGLDRGRADAALSPGNHLRAGFSYLRDRPFATLAGKLDSRSTGVRTLGLLADGTGFRPDGSMRYGAYLEEIACDPSYRDREIPPMVDRIERRLRQFAGDAQYDLSRQEVIVDQLSRLRDRLGVHVAVVLPPVSSDVDAAVRAAADLEHWWESYWRRLPAALEEAGIPTVAARTPRELGWQDSGLFDGVHGGEGMLSEMLLRLGERIDIGIDREAIEQRLQETNRALPVLFEELPECAQAL